MQDALQKELATYEKRTPKSAAAHKRALERIPLGVASNRDKIIKFEGAYHGLHDAALVSVKPKSEDWGDPEAPNSVAGGAGVPRASLENVLIASFNSLKSVERRFKENSSQIAAVIL